MENITQYANKPTVDTGTNNLWDTLCHYLTDFFIPSINTTGSDLVK